MNFSAWTVLCFRAAVMCRRVSLAPLLQWLKVGTFRASVGPEGVRLGFDHRQASPLFRFTATLPPLGLILTSKD